MGESKAVPQQGRPVRGELLTVKEAAEYIHTGMTTLYRCIRNGSIPFFRPPRGKMLLDTADLDEWLRTSRVSAGTMPEDI